jgi:tetratricopeptide (TPR) repeat protein
MESLNNAPFISVEEAVSRRHDNTAGLWPSRGEENRLEPECWPVIRPRFRIPSAAKVFTMGSCFARNIELHLSHMGFHVPAVSTVKDHPQIFAKNGPELLNKYTPASIFEELEWTRGILDRDDTVREEDVLPLLFDLGKDRYIDLHTRADPGYGFTFEEQMTRRRVIYSLNREAFDCDLAVVTLGLIETWWDRHTGSSVEFHANFLRHDDKERFVFRPLNFAEALDAVSRAVTLLLRNPRTNVLITTSPIPMSRTFTNDDVIIANMQSKSLLRTVAGVIREQFGRVDYFPSYESVMLTRKAEVWQNDLIHLDSNFVGQIMARVVDNFVVQSDSAQQYSELLKFSEYVEARDWERAQPLYHRYVASLPVEPGFGLLLAIAEYEIAHGHTADAAIHLKLAEDEGNSPVKLGPAHLMRCARAYAELGDAVSVECCRRRIIALLKDNPLITKTMIVSWRRAGWKAEALWLMKEAEQLFAGQLYILEFLARTSKDLGAMDDFERLIRAAIDAGAGVEAYLLYASELTRVDRLTDAIPVLMAGFEHAAHPVLSKRLLAGLMKTNRVHEAEEVARRALQRHPDHALPLGTVAQVLAKCGAHDEALEIGRRSLELGNTEPRINAIVDRLANRNNG